MKYALYLMSSLLFTACGSEAPERVNQRGSIDLADHQAALVKTTKDLPRCDRNRLNKIIFVNELSAFKVCRNEVWTDVDSKKASELADTVVEILQIRGSELNLCPSDTNGSCVLDGGEYIRYADGRVKYSARVSRKKNAPIPNAYQTMETQDSWKAKITHESNWPSSEVLLISDVARDGITSGVWLRYNADDRVFSVFFDKNQDGTYSEGDEILEAPELLDF